MLHIFSPQIDFLLGCAIRQKKPLDTVKALLEMGANPNRITSIGLSRWSLKRGLPLYAAVNLAHVDGYDKRIIDLLLEHGADVNKQARVGAETPLHQSARYDRKLTCAFLKRGAKEVFSKPDGYTALHHAAYQCKFEIVELLLEAGFDVNAHVRFKAGVSSGETPLQHIIALVPSTEELHLKIIDLLLDKGADPHLKTAGSGRLNAIEIGMKLIALMKNHDLSRAPESYKAQHAIRFSRALRVVQRLTAS